MIATPAPTSRPALSSRSVLMVGAFTATGRPYRQICDDLALRLEAAGWSVRTTSPRGSRPGRLLDMIATAWRRRGEYAAAHVDVFSGLAFTWAEAVCWTLRRARRPFVLTLHGGGLPDFARRWPRRVRSLLATASLVTAPSRYLQERMAPFREAIRLVPNPIDLGLYPYRLRDRPGPRLVWLRSFHAIYNPSLAVRVLARLAAEVPGVRLEMIGPDKGDGSLGDALALADRLGVGDRLGLVRGIPKAEVPGRLAGHDVFLNTPDVDNTPVSVREAQACGLCVVSTDVGGLPYLLDHGRDALLVPRDDPEAMAAAVRRIWSQPGLAAGLSRQSRMSAEACDWPVILDLWDELLCEVTRPTRPT